MLASSTKVTIWCPYNPFRHWWAVNTIRFFILHWWGIVRFFIAKVQSTSHYHRVLPPWSRYTTAVHMYNCSPLGEKKSHYDDIIMGTIASQITSLTIVYSIVYSGADQSNHQSSASLAFVWGIHRGPVNSPHKWPVTRKMFPFDDVIMNNSIDVYVIKLLWLMNID